MRMRRRRRRKKEEMWHFASVQNQLGNEVEVSSFPTHQQSLCGTPVSQGQGEESESALLIAVAAWRMQNQGLNSG